MPTDETRVPGPLALARHRLLDTGVCPACGNRLTHQLCAACGMDVSGDAGALVWEASLAAVRALDDRAGLIGRIRSTQRAALAVSHIPSRPTQPAPAPLVRVPLPATSRAVPSVVPTRSASVRTPWRVQTVLQVLGVALLATASIVFLVFSWNVLSVAARGAVIGLGTVVVLVLAAWLRGHGLDHSAQAVGVLGVVLTVLDAWAVHATGLAGPVDPAAYAAVACVVCAGLLGAYGGTTGVRAGTVAAAVLLPVAPLMLLGRVSGPAAAGGLLVAALALATLRFVPGRPLAAERTTLGVAAALAGVAAGLTGTAGVLGAPSTGHRWASIGVLLGTALVCGLQAALSASAARAAGRATRSARAWAVAAGLLLATAATAASVTLGMPAPVLPAATGLLLGVVLTAWPATRPGHGLARAATDGVTLGALAVCMPTVVRLLDVGTAVVLDPTAGAWSDVAGSLVGSAVIGLLLVGVARRTGSAVSVPARHGSAALAVAVVLAGAASAGASALDPARLGATAALVGVAATATAVGRGRRGSVRWYLRATAAVALVAAFVASLGLPWWTGGVLAASAVFVLSARRWGGGEPAAAVTSTVAATLGWAAATQLAIAGGSPGYLAVTGAAGLTVGVLTVVALQRRPSSTERHALLGLAGAIGAIGWSVGVSTTPGPTITAAGAVTLLLGTVVWVAAIATAVRGRRVLAPVAARLGAALVPAVGALLAVSAQALTGIPGPDALALVVVVLGGLAAVAAGRVPPTPVDQRPALEASGWAVVVVGIALAVARSPDLTAVALVLAALVAGASAARGDRRDERWLALGLVVAASWCSLGARDVGTPEAYLAPLGVVLAVVGVRRWRAGRASAELVGGGLALITLPVSVVDDPLVVGTVALSRPVLATVLAAALVAAALVVGRVRVPPARRDGTDPLLALAGLAALLAVLSPGRRAVTIAADSWSTGDAAGWVELWGLAAAVVLGGAALAALRAPVLHAVQLRRVAAWVVLVVATVPAVLTHDDGTAGLVRLLVVGLVGAWLAARAGVTSGPPAASSDRLAHGVVLLGAATVAALLRTWEVPDDATLAVVGGVLVVLGVLHLRRVAGASTWAALTPGLVGVLVVPTFTALATATPWRVGLVVVGGLVAVGAGARWRWQAPFVIGSAAVAVELLVQLAPVTRAALGGLGWWPVLAVGGAALLALGLTYERRMRDAREAVRYVALMR